jgi:phosphotransferase system  glucose/maltose/N-acetylglucosamine-specific IIC component
MWLAVVIALILYWAFGLNLWVAAIIAVVAAPIIGAVFQAFFGARTSTVPGAQAGEVEQKSEQGK